MSEWMECKLGELIDSISETYKFTENDVIFLNTSDILAGKVLNHFYSNPKILPGQAKKRIKKGDLLYSEIRPANKRYARIDFNSENYVVSTKLMVLRSKGDIEPLFLELYLTSEDILEYLQMIAEDRSGTFPQITFNNISSLDILLPPLPEQKAIANVLSCLDDKIDLLHRQNKTLEAMAEALFRQWFVEEASDDWDIITINDIADVTTGKGLKKEEYTEYGKYPVLGANGEIGRTNNYLFSRDDKIIITGRVGTHGKVFLINEMVWISDNALIIKPKKDCFRYVLYFILKGLDYASLNVGSTQPLITQTDIKKEELQTVDGLFERFNKMVLPVFDKIEANVNQIQSLEKLRDTLLPKLISGEVRVAI